MPNPCHYQDYDRSMSPLVCIPGLREIYRSIAIFLSRSLFLALALARYVSLPLFASNMAHVRQSCQRFGHGLQVEVPKTFKLFLLLSEAALDTRCLLPREDHNLRCSRRWNTRPRCRCRANVARVRQSCQRSSYGLQVKLSSCSFFSRKRLLTRGASASSSLLLSSLELSDTKVNDTRWLFSQMEYTPPVPRSSLYESVRPHPLLSSFLLLSSLELSDTKVYEPYIRALLGTASHFCEVVVLKFNESVQPHPPSEEGTTRKVSRTCF